MPTLELDWEADRMPSVMGQIIHDLDARLSALLPMTSTRADAERIRVERARDDFGVAAGWVVLLPVWAEPFHPSPLRSDRRDSCEHRTWGNAWICAVAIARRAERGYCTDVHVVVFLFAVYVGITVLLWLVDRGER